MRLILALASACAFMVCLPAAARAQLAAAQFGTHFLVAFPDTTHTYTGPYINSLRQDVGFFLFSRETATVTITGPGYARTVTVAPDAARVVWLLSDTAAPQRIFVDLPNIPTADVFEIRSDKPITMTCYYVTHDGCEAFAPAPVSSWGTDYRAMGIRAGYVANLNRDTLQEEGVTTYLAPAEIVVIASEPDTHVEIHATTDLLVTDTYSVRDTAFTLNAGEAAMVQTIQPFPLDLSGRDLSGTIVTADKPIGVLSGNTRSQGGRGANTEATATGNSGAGALIEWLMPANLHGATFVYRPFCAVGVDKMEEFVRVYATAPGTTTVSMSNGLPTVELLQGEFYTVRSTLLPDPPGSVTKPFAIRTNQPAQAMVVTGSFDRRPPGQAAGEVTVETWAPAMSTLPPREAWYNSARFHVPSFPGYLNHYAVVTADSSATVYLDGLGVPLAMASVEGAPFKEARVEVAVGDHAIRSVNGRAAVVMYGVGRGLESFAPIATRKHGDRSPASAMPHPSVYTEDISVAYSYPVPGIEEEALPSDSVEIARIDRCDSTTVIITRIGRPWTFLPYTTSVEPDSTNADVLIEPIWTTTFVGYALRFRPRDPLRDARATFTLTSPTGGTWSVPYAYAARALGVTPDPVELLDILINQEQTRALTLTNRRPFVITPLAVRLKQGTNGFSLRDVKGIGTPLRPGDSTTLTLAFTGTEKNHEYTDTLVITTECGTYEVPLRAHTGPYPIPTITGKDWGERLLRTVNDTLSYVANLGSLGYTIASIAIVNDAAGAFSLIAPDWRAIAPVPPAGLDSLGISFRPPSVGPFAAVIRLVTTDGDTAQAALLGVGIGPIITMPDISIGLRCIDAPFDTTVRVLNAGTSAFTITGLTVTSDPTASAMLDTASLTPFLPHSLSAGEQLAIPVRITPAAPGPINVRVAAIVGAEVDKQDSTAVITGTAASCTRPRLVVDDHDFDSIFITLTKPGFVTVRNLGPGDATVQTMTPAADTAGAFAVLSPIPPFPLRDGDSMRVACTFTPASVGLKTARIEFMTDAGPLTSALRGVGRKLRVPALIRRDYHGRPGDAVTAYVELGERLDTLPVTKLEIAVQYRTELLDFLAAEPVDGAQHGWSWFGAQYGDTVGSTIMVAPNPPAAGNLLALRFLVRFDRLDSSELPFTVSTGLPYVEVITEPGLVRRDPICGLLERLFTFAPNGFRLDQNIPNPLTGEGKIGFEIPFENPTRLVIYDALGREIAVLLDEPLKPGTYAVTIPAGTLAAGLYYYRLTSGEFTALRKMVVR